MTSGAGYRDLVPGVDTGPAAAGRRRRVVIVGAGFGGLATARGLAGADLDVTIVDRHNFHTFQPLLYQVATAGLNPADVAYPVRGIFQRQLNVSFRHAEVAGVDWRQRHVVFADGTDLAFDHLVIAAGATTNFFGVIGAEEHAFPLYSLAEAAQLRNHVLSCFEAADRNPHLIDEGALTFVVVGGGPTGVEVAGALSELISHVLSRDFQRLAVARARVLLVEREDHLLPPFHPKSQYYSRQTLVSRGVEVRLGESVERISATRVHLGSGEVLPAHTLVWAAGIQANPLAAALGVQQARGGRIVVGPDLVVKGREQVFAIGDVAHIESGRLRPQPLPQLAPVAVQSGAHVARQIRRIEAGRRTRTFHYLDKGTMATVGRRAAVAELPLHIRLHGSPAWMAWLGLHLLTLVGFRNRVSVFLNWAWSYLTWDRGPRLIFSPLPDEDAGLAPPSSIEDELG